MTEIVYISALTFVQKLHNILFGAGGEKPAPAYHPAVLGATSDVMRGIEEV